MFYLSNLVLFRKSSSDYSAQIVYVLDLYLYTLKLHWSATIHNNLFYQHTISAKAYTAFTVSSKYAIFLHLS